MDKILEQLTESMPALPEEEQEKLRDFVKSMRDSE